jgi:GNAT superfamily N-acetyltransferase
LRVSFRAASIEDEQTFLPMMEALWAHEGIPFDAPAIRKALAALFSDPGLGRVWLSLVENAVAGYAMGTWGFSTEQGGRFLLLDELFVLPAFRGKGVGAAILAFVEQEAAREGAGAVRIEVSVENGPARELYRAAGYADPRRLFLAKRLAPTADTTSGAAGD